MLQVVRLMGYWLMVVVGAGLAFGLSVGVLALFFPSKPRAPTAAAFTALEDPRHRAEAHEGEQAPSG